MKDRVTFPSFHTNNRKERDTCFYGDHLTIRAVAHEVGSNNISCVVGAAPQALDLTAQIHGVAAVNDAVAVSGHGNVENCAATIPGHRDSIRSTFLHSRYVIRSTGHCRGGRFKLLVLGDQIQTLLTGCPEDKMWLLIVSWTVLWMFFTCLRHRPQGPGAAAFIIKRCDVNCEVIATVGALYGAAVWHWAAVVAVPSLVAVSLHSVA